MKDYTHTLLIGTNYSKFYVRNRLIRRLGTEAPDRLQDNMIHVFKETFEYTCKTNLGKIVEWSDGAIESDSALDERAIDLVFNQTIETVFTYEMLMHLTGGHLL